MIVSKKDDRGLQLTTPLTHLHLRAITTNGMRLTLSIPLEWWGHNLDAT